MAVKSEKVVQVMKKVIFYLILASLLSGIAFSEEAAQPYGTDYEEGTVITFGSYEQDNDLSNGQEPIEWIVIDKHVDGSLVLMSKYALDVKPYNEDRVSVTWETSTLRKWLNENFYNAAFSAWEQAKIVPVTLENEDNPSFGTKGGNATEDSVWLLSINEVTDIYSKDKVYSWLTDNDSRICYPTAYAVAQRAHNGYGACWWWLRSPGDYSKNAALVFSDGLVFSRGDRVDNGGIANFDGYSIISDGFGVRPVVVVLP